jgi:hypothetical protein
MPCLKEAIQEAMKNLPTIYMYTGEDGAEHPEDSNLKDIQHLAETIQKVCNLNVNSDNAQQVLSKQQVVEIVEIVEKELLGHPATKPVLWDAIITDPLEIRVKDENQLFEELNKVAQEVLKKYPHFGTSIEEVIIKSLFMWHGCLNIDKECRLKDVHGIEPQENRLAIHDFLVGQSSSNPWIRKGFSSARLFRQTPDQSQSKKDYNWIPSDSPYWE